MRPPTQPAPEPPAALSAGARDRRFGAHTARALAPWTYTAKGEDCVFSGLVGEGRGRGGSPCVIVADGASNLTTSSGALAVGGGAAAARLACATLRHELHRGLHRHRNGSSRRPQSLEGTLHSLLHHFGEVEATLARHNATGHCPGATTLLCALLLPLGAQRRLYWVYGYLGDGELVIISPSRSLSGWPCESWLLTPHSLGDRPLTLPRPPAMARFAPVVGALPYAPGDVLYAASDGIGYLQRHLAQTRKLTFGQYLWQVGCAAGAGGLPTALPDLRAGLGSAPPTLYDDASVAAIWTI